jgi:manganese/zinc/iron transport system permease protein
VNADDLTVIVTAGLVATACGLLGPFLVLRRQALMGDAVSHAVLPGIVATYLLFDTRAPLPVILGAGFFAVVCVLGIDALRATKLVAADAAIGLVFPALFALGVLGVQRYAAGVHLDLDSTIYGEIAFAPFRTWIFGPVEIAQSVVVNGLVALANLAFVLLVWKELKATSFDPEFSQTVRISPALLGRALLGMVAVTAVTAFESVGAILVVTLLIVPAATAHLLTDRLVTLVVLTVGIGWICATAGYGGALAADASIAGTMGLVAGALFAVALVVAPQHGVLARARRRRTAQRTFTAPAPA